MAAETVTIRAANWSATTVIPIGVPQPPIWTAWGPYCCDPTISRAPTISTTVRVVRLTACWSLGRLPPRASFTPAANSGRITGRGTRRCKESAKRDPTVIRSLAGRCPRPEPGVLARTAWKDVFRAAVHEHVAVAHATTRARRHGRPDGVPAGVYGPVGSGPANR